MSNAGKRERAEAAFGHLQQAASEVIAAAHDALDLLDEVVTTADLGEVFDTVSLLGRSVSVWGTARSAPTPRSRPNPADPADPARPASPVQRIAVR